MTLPLALSLLLERGGWSFSGGVLFEAPTSPEVTFSPGPGKTAPLLTNSQWFITPYLGVARRQGRSFSQTFISYRDQTNGEVVTQDPLTRLPTQDLVMLSSQVDSGCVEMPLARSPELLPSRNCTTPRHRRTIGGERTPTKPTAASISSH
ncbi:MAG: hypothetical protein R3B96_23755 [Pirellulaceae bacterium]